MTGRTLRQMRSHAWLYVMILPVIVYFSVFVYYPLVQGVLSSFQEFRLLGGGEWVGTQNYVDVWETSKFWQVVRNTLLIGGGTLIFGFLPPIIVALALNEVRLLVFKKLAQTTVYLPHLFSWVVIGGMWIYLLSPSGGLVNELLALLDVGPVRFLTNTNWARTMMIGLPIWKDMGYAAIIYLAAITSISPTLYEAARIDGASRFQQVYQITVPLLTGTMKVVFMLNILGLLRIFDQIFVMRNPVIQRGIDVIMTYVYDMGIQRYELGFASAISVLVLIATLGMTAIVWKITGFGRAD
ncbi:MAG TPA: ABC transporter permease subunit [Thermomicrobiales bacterium]|jgi:putative aldouronate transport system permease protein|nr:ABC transporter permease subunit [Thermomicrobiales bacterium]